MRETASQEPGRDRSVADTIADVLGQRIVLGQLPPGEKLRQDHIAIEFRASHVPVREAFRRLEARGLLVSEPRRGVRVAPIDPAAVREVTEMRAVLEGLALRHGAPMIGKAEIGVARAAIVAGEASNDLVVWESANRQFHRAITMACAMPRLIAAIDDLHQASARFLLTTWKDLAWQPRSDAEHLEIIRLIETGAFEEAEALLRQHILDAGQALLKRL